MKKIILTVAVTNLLVLSSCGDKKVEQGSQDSVNTELESVAKLGLTVKEASDSISASDDAKGKEVTIYAYCWGISETTNGTVRLNLGDEKADGMIQVAFYAEFPDTKKDELTKIAKNTMVTVKGKLGSDAYSKFINESEIIKVE